jgi:uncharacterized peroxidase-related enzyme
MSDFKVHTIETAPDASKPLLEVSQKSFNFIPNLHGVLAESPQALEAYTALSALFSATSLSTVEKNVVWMAINVENRCLYCVPAHTGIAKMQGVDAATVEALRNAAPLADKKLETLREFTLKVVRQHGVVGESDVAAFLGAGFTQQNILDVIVGVAHKTISNYVNHFAQTPVDAAFAGEAWTAPAAAAAE